MARQPSVFRKHASFGTFAPLRRSSLHGYPLALNSNEFGYSNMPSLPNYLRTKRKQISLSQEEVAFLLGIKGMDKGGKVSRDENYARTPTLETALAYEAIYGKPTRELFAGLYWLSFKQAQDLGAEVRKGEKSFPVIFWKMFEAEENGEMKKIPFLRYHNGIHV